MGGAARRGAWLLFSFSHFVSPPSPFHPQQNEVFRENQFNTWAFTQKNFVPLAVMVFVLPLSMHFMVKDEFAIRDKVREKEVQPRF